MSPATLRDFATHDNKFESDIRFCRAAVRPDSGAGSAISRSRPNNGAFTGRADFDFVEPGVSRDSRWVVSDRVLSAEFSRYLLERGRQRNQPIGSDQSTTGRFGQAFKIAVGHRVQTVEPNGGGVLCCRARPAVRIVVAGSSRRVTLTTRVSVAGRRASGWRREGQGWNDGRQPGYGCVARDGWRT